MRTYKGTLFDGESCQITISVMSETAEQAEVAIRSKIAKLLRNMPSGYLYMSDGPTGTIGNIGTIGEYLAGSTGPIGAQGDIGPVELNVTYPEWLYQGHNAGNIIVTWPNTEYTFNNNNNNGTITFSEVPTNCQTITSYNEWEPVTFTTTGVSYTTSQTGNNF